MNEITNFRGEVVEGAEPTSEERRIAAFIATVGERVRLARQRKGLSRRVLSDRSGVSQRYLAQLESGAGNISIALLYRVARALDCRVEWLVGEDDPWRLELADVAQMFGAE